MPRDPDDPTVAALVIDRLKERVPTLAGRVEGAAHLAQMMAANQMPQVTPAANVIATGLAGGTADASTGFFRQSFDETVTVYLTFRNVQGPGGNALDLFDEVKWSVIEAICGWGPETAVGVFRLLRGQVVNMATGTMLYQIDFALGDQLRILT
jgi:hypothetical protein